MRSKKSRSDLDHHEIASKALAVVVNFCVHHEMIIEPQWFWYPK